MKTATCRLGRKKKQICCRKLQVINTDKAINVAHMLAHKHRYKDMVQNTGYAIKLIPWLGVDVSRFFWECWFSLTVRDKYVSWPGGSKFPRGVGVSRVDSCLKQESAL